MVTALGIITLGQKIVCLVLSQEGVFQKKTVFLD